MMKRALKVVPALLVSLVLFTACAGGGMTIGDIPPPPHRVPPPAVGAPVAAGTGAPAAGTGAVAAPDGEVFTLSFAHITNDAHPRGYMISRFAEIVNERSGGRLVVNVFPESQLGNDFEVMTQIQQDAIDLTSMLSSNMTHIVPEMAVFDLPYLFQGPEHAAAALNGSLGTYLTSAMADHGLVNFGFLTSGFRHITNNVRPVNAVTDLDGTQIRVSQSHFLIAQFQAINAGGISVPFGELHAALAAGLADGQENPLATIISGRLYEVQNYLTISNHSFTTYPIFMPQAAYDRLPVDLRMIIRQAFTEIQPIQWQMIEDMTAEHLEFLYTTDIEINYLSDAGIQGFMTAMQVVHDEFAQMPGGALMLQLAAMYAD
ncbi:MAG: TRAP transporter substrate-binding protein [Defluviitaleaceae bacterium]|nr:TRAP transporter substrate-binding protein [Defluviitaleaceae bacterium]